MAVWTQVSCDALDDPGDWILQGDVLGECYVPIFKFLLDQAGDLDEPHNIPLDIVDLIVITQSCDLRNRKAPMVACCPIHKLESFEEINPHFKNKGEWEKVRTGRMAGLHMIAGVDKPEDNRNALVVDYREIHSLPFEYVFDFVKTKNQRPRLNSPYLEHFSQAFARFFMRVGLPAEVPRFE